MMRWALLAVALLLLLLVGGTLYVGMPFYERVSPFTEDLTDVAERARTERLPDEEIGALLERAARKRNIEIKPGSLEILRPEPGAIHIKMVATGYAFGNDGLKLTMNLETKRP